MEHAVAVGDEPRYTLLETIREYALEQLAQQGELMDTSERLSAYALALAEAAVPELHSPRGPAWLDRLEADHGSLRAVLQRSIAAKQTERALRLGSALWPFWWRKGYLSEGRAQLQAILGLPWSEPETAEQQRLRAGVLLGAGRLAIDIGDYQVGRDYLKESLAESLKTRFFPTQDLAPRPAPSRFVRESSTQNHRMRLVRHRTALLG